MKKTLATAIYNYLQSGNYRIDYVYCGDGSKDNQAIADLIDLTDITIDDIITTLGDEYQDRLHNMDSGQCTVERMAKSISTTLCGLWIGKQASITWGYNWSNKYFEGLRAGDDTLFMIR